MSKKSKNKCAIGQNIGRENFVQKSLEKMKIFGLKKFFPIAHFFPYFLYIYSNIKKIKLHMVY
jgi:hypothetical protein